MRLIIHIGAPKCGTSALQASLADNREALRARRILYPRAGCDIGNSRHTRQVGLRIAFAPPDEPPNGLMSQLPPGDLEFRKAYGNSVLAELAGEIQDGNHHTVIVSDEALFVFPSVRMIENFRRFAAEHFSEVSVVCFLREPSGMLPSLYSQQVKMGSPATWRKFLDGRLKRPLFKPALRSWDSVFDISNMSVRLLRGDSVALFLETAGLDVTLPTSPRGRNASLSEIGLPLLRHLNERYRSIGKPRPAKLRRIFEVAEGAAPWRPPAQDIALIDKSFSSEMQEIAVRYSLASPESRRSPSHPDEIATPKDGCAPELSEGRIRELAEIIAKALE